MAAVGKLRRLCKSRSLRIAAVHHFNDKLRFRPDTTSDGIDHRLRIPVMKKTRMRRRIRPTVSGGTASKRLKGQDGAGRSDSESQGDVFIRPEQVAELVARHGEISRARVVPALCLRVPAL